MNRSLIFPRCFAATMGSVSGGGLRIFGAADQVTEVPGDLLELGISEGFRGSHSP